MKILHLFKVLVGLRNIPSSLKRYVMELNVLFGYPTKGIVDVLNSFRHKQNPSKSIDPWCLITKYLNEGITFIVSFGKATQYRSTCQKIR
jgi:hypothetical protein